MFIHKSSFSALVHNIFYYLFQVIFLWIIEKRIGRIETLIWNRRNLECSKYKESINKRTFDVILYTFLSIFQFLHILHIVESKFVDLKYKFFFVNFVDMLKYISLLAAISLSVWYDMPFWIA